MSGATFKANKISLIYFTRRLIDEEPPNLRFDDTDITPSLSVKVLGVTLNVKLVIDEYISRVSIKGLRVYLTL